MSDEKPHKKVGRKVDNLVMGVILGGAIGSVLGLTLAPRKGEETRKIIKKKSGELIEKGKEVGETFVRDNKETFESAKYQIKKGRKGGFWRWLLKGKKKKSDQEITHFIDEE
jgi:gas vesicle protein